MPAEVVIVLSDHVRDDVFPKRIGCSPRKYLKLAAKAWRSTEPILKGERTNPAHYDREQPGTVYRKLMGMIYIFAPDHENPTGRVVLVTVYPPSKAVRGIRPPKLVPH